MALAGLVVDNDWAQLGIALAIALALPALIADRLLAPDAAKSDGLVGDVYSIMWICFPLVVLVFSSLTGNLLRSQAGRFQESGYQRLAELTMFVAGPAPSAKPAAELPPEPGVIITSDAGPILLDAASVAVVETDGGPVATKTEKEVYTPAELFKEMSPGVVTITVHNSRFGMGGGTGFIIDKSGIILTNHHVIDNASTVSVKLLDGQWANEVELLVEDPDQDLAILKITTDQGLHVVELGDSDEVQVGERAISIGNPLGLEHTLTDGLVSARRTFEGKKMIQMSTPISPGNSGGPLFNLRGEVIGVSTATLSNGFSGGQNLNLAIPINQAKKMLKDDFPDRKRVGGGSPSGKGSW